MKLRAALFQLKFPLWRSGPSPCGIVYVPLLKGKQNFRCFLSDQRFLCYEICWIIQSIIQIWLSMSTKNVASPPPVTCGIMNIKRTKPTLSSSHRRPSISFYGIASLNSSHNCSQRLLMGSPQQMEASSPGRPPWPRERMPRRLSEWQTKVLPEKKRETKTSHPFWPSTL